MPEVTSVLTIIGFSNTKTSKKRRILAKGVLLCIIGGMNRVKNKEIGDYVKELFESLYDWDHDRVAMEAEISTLHRYIERLMEISAETKEVPVRTMLTFLEHDARKCKECIERRLAIGN
jgi:hypothetical protein